MLTAIALLLLQAPAADPACANARVAMPAELAAWGSTVPVTAGTQAGDGATLALGQAATVALHRAGTLKLDPAPAKPAAADSFGGTLRLSVAQAGSYRVALGSGAWVDILRGGKAIAAAAHAHGPRCTGIAKIVDFRLDPGTYVIQLSGVKANSLTALVVKA